MSQRSRYENRAKLINRNIRKDDTLPPVMGREEAWSLVKSKEQVEQFYQLYYPHYPDILCKAIADYYHKAVSGQIEIPENYTKLTPVKKAWDYEAEILELKKQGQVVNAIKNLESLSLAVSETVASAGPLAQID